LKVAQRELDGKGRAEVRYSGTEALARVMVGGVVGGGHAGADAGDAGEIQKAPGV